MLSDFITTKNNSIITTIVSYIFTTLFLGFLLFLGVDIYIHNLNNTLAPNVPLPPPPSWTVADVFCLTCSSITTDMWVLPTIILFTSVLVALFLVYFTMRSIHSSNLASNMFKSYGILIIPLLSTLIIYTFWKIFYSSLSTFVFSPNPASSKPNVIIHIFDFTFLTILLFLLALTTLTKYENSITTLLLSFKRLVPIAVGTYVLLQLLHNLPYYGLFLYRTLQILLMYPQKSPFAYIVIITGQIFFLQLVIDLLLWNSSAESQHSVESQVISVQVAHKSSFIAGILLTSIFLIITGYLTTTFYLLDFFSLNNLQQDNINGWANPIRLNFTKINAPPESGHPFGFDYLGRDRFVRFVFYFTFLGLTSAKFALITVVFSLLLFYFAKKSYIVIILDIFDAVPRFIVFLITSIFFFIFYQKQMKIENITKYSIIDYYTIYFLILLPYVSILLKNLFEQEGTRKVAITSFVNVFIIIFIELFVIGAFSDATETSFGMTFSTKGFSDYLDRAVWIILLIQIIYALLRFSIKYLPSTRYEDEQLYP